MVNKKEQVKKYLVKSVKKALKENVVTGGGAPAISNPVTTGGTGEAHQGGKKIRVKKNFKETFTKAITGNPRFAKSVKNLKENNFKIPVEKLVNWASKNVLHATNPPYPEIQRYAEENNITVENLANMAKFYLSNVQMFGSNKATYADVLKDLIANIKEISFTQNSIHNRPPLDSVNENINPGELKKGQIYYYNGERTLDPNKGAPIKGELEFQGTDNKLFRFIWKSTSDKNTNIGDSFITNSDGLRYLSIENLEELPSHSETNRLYPSTPITEIRYGQFSKQSSTRTPSETLHKAIKEIHKRIKDVKKIMEFTSRMKTEFKDKYSAQYMERTNKALSSLQTELAELYKHFKQIK